MKKKLILLSIVFISFIVLFVSCDKKSLSPGNGEFLVKVVDPQGQPVAGAYIEGGIDWEEFRVTTDNEGWACLPGYALDVRATIYRNNFFSKIENDLRPGEYVRTPTPCIFVEIGEIEGEAIRFESDMILSVTYQGDYHVYSYNHEGLTELATAEFPYSVKNFKLYGDTLWYTTHENGIYVYSLSDPLNPRQLFHLDIDGYLWPFAKRDSIVAVGSFYEPGPLRVFSYFPDGNIEELDRIENYLIREMTFISNYLITLGNYYNLPTVFDLQDPTDVRVVYNGENWEYDSGFMYYDTLVLVSRSGNAWSGTVDYLMLDLSDPSNPIDSYEFSATGWISEIIDDSTALGNYYYHSCAFCVFNRSSHSKFETIAIISEEGFLNGYGGCFPPYFIICDHLWMLIEG
jgi:hypothetical protein